MFSSDHYKEKDFLSALTALIEPLQDIETCQSTFGISAEELKQRYIANCDLILKYITIRFFDTNTSMLIKCLDLLENLLQLLDDSGYLLNEYEASSFLPFFINKV